MKRMLAVAATTALVMSMEPISTVHARGTVPIINHENMLIATGSGRTPLADDVKKAIATAAASAKYRWTISDVEPANLAATSVVRGKHTVIVNIAYSSTHYSITYRDSQNMNYRLDEGVPEIHPNYNVWVQQLMDAINAQLLKL